MPMRPYAARPGGVLLTPPPTNGGGPRPTDLGDLTVLQIPDLPLPGSSTELFLSAQVILAQNHQHLLAAIVQELREQVQRGYVYPLVLTVASQAPDEYEFDTPLFSVSLTNDGPANIEYKLPYSGQAQWVQLRPTEVITFTFIKGLIRSLGVRLTAAGGAATAVRVVGTY